MQVIFSTLYTDTEAYVLVILLSTNHLKPMSIVTRSLFVAVLGLAVLSPVFASAAATTTSAQKARCLTSARTSFTSANSTARTAQLASTTAAYKVYSTAVTASKSQTSTTTRAAALTTAKTAYKNTLKTITGTYKARLNSNQTVYKTALKSCK